MLQNNRKPGLKTGLFTFVFLFTLQVVSALPCRAEEQIDSLVYAVFPYLPDTEYYQELIEQRWAEIEPDIRLERAEWDCYKDDAPDGIDVIMYDAVSRDALIEAGSIQPVDIGSFRYRMTGRSIFCLHEIPLILLWLNSSRFIPRCMR
ncbi:MAG: hypothetical protein IIY55_12125 [Blautia sp.]|nr:hypothetical protein [Blautia sp.]